MELLKQGGRDGARQGRSVESQVMKELETVVAALEVVVKTLNESMPTDVPLSP